MTHHLSHFIDGVRQEGEFLIERKAPRDGTSFARLPIGSAGEVRKAVEAAKTAGIEWGRLPPGDRAAFVAKMSDWLMQEYGEPGAPTRIKKLISEETGKPLAEADIELVETADFLRFFSQATPAIRDRTPALDMSLWPTKRAEISYDPLGVVGIIKPWNYPLEMIGWTVGPALVAGNTVVIKPSEKASVTADVFAEMSKAVGLPPGVLNVVYGDGSTGQALASHPDVRMVSFTGSGRTGRHIARICADRLAIAKLELSGNDAAIVLADADVELTARGLTWGAFCNAGQVCVGVKRAYVDATIAPALTQRIVELTSKLREGRDYGPLIDIDQFRSVDRLVSDAVAGGATQLCGGSPESGGLYYSPTVLANVPQSAKLLDEECFGPVLPIFVTQSTLESVRFANASTYGLGASVWTSNLERGAEVARTLEVGMVWINDVNVAVPQAPWGGRKSSGVGFELSDDVIREYSAPRHINIELSNASNREWWFPYD